MKLKYIVGLSALLITGLVKAECPDGLDSEKMTECIMVEGSGKNYQDWLTAYNQPNEKTK